MDNIKKIIGKIFKTVAVVLIIFVSLFAAINLITDNGLRDVIKGYTTIDKISIKLK